MKKMSQLTSDAIVGHREVLVPARARIGKPSGGGRERDLAGVEAGAATVDGERVQGKLSNSLKYLAQRFFVSKVLVE